MSPVYSFLHAGTDILTPEKQLYRIASEYVSLIHQDSDGSENWALVRSRYSTLVISHPNHD